MRPFARADKFMGQPPWPIEIDEARDLSADRRYAEILMKCEAKLRSLLSPEEVDAHVFYSAVVPPPSFGSGFRDGWFGSGDGLLDFFAMLARSRR